MIAAREQGGGTDERPLPETGKVYRKVDKFIDACKCNGVSLPKAK